MRPNFAHLLVAAAVVTLATASPLVAQVDPTKAYRTLSTEHFRVHFTPELERMARRAAVSAESAYVELSRHLRHPRGKIDVVISDDVDFANGFATVFPSNRIVVYANPPVFESALRFTDDPVDLLLTHELTHLFHLDRVGGIWKVFQTVFGRSPYLFPNAWQPSWLTEGLAVYYETKLTGSGRLAGSQHRMIAGSAAIAHRFPRLDQLSLANPHFPFGYATYVYGSLFVDHLAGVHGDRAIRSFVESSSRQLIPLYLDGPARRAFGRSFTAAYRLWADSLVRNAPPLAPPVPGWRDLTVDGVFTSFPRWLSDSAIVYTGTPGRETNAAYVLAVADTGGGVKRTRIGRRNSNAPNVLLADGSLLYSQLEFTSLYNLRSDLYVDRKTGDTHRLTYGQRLASPDARHDGLIVAVMSGQGGTGLVLVSADGKAIVPLARGSLDEQWSDPRWSPEGRHIAAVRWLLGGTSQIVVIDTTGRALQTIVSERTVNAAPSWSPDGRSVYFSSDRSGIANLYRAPFRAAFADTMMIPGLELVSDAQTGLFEPQLSPGGRELAAVVFKADGYHIGIAPLDSLRASDPPLTDLPATTLATPVASDESPVTRYSPWRSLRPTYWVPFFEAALEDESTRFGAFTSGNDVLGRHNYTALLFVPSDNSGLTGALHYRNARLGQPLVELVAAQDWENYRCLRESPDGPCLGILRRRTREGSLGLTLIRQRVRTYSVANVSGGVEARDFAPDSPPLMALADSAFRRAYYYPRVSMSLGWSNTQRPPFAISAEDGVSLSSTARYRWRTGDTVGGTVSVVGSASAFKAIDLPGFAHHVLAVRAAAGQTDSRATGYLEVGGVSGGTVDLLPGYTLGEGRRTFGVRGFPAASLFGNRAIAGSAEYRVPLRLPGRGLGTLPVFLDRTNVTLFGDAGSAWCTGLFATRTTPDRSICTREDFSFGRTFAPSELPFIYLEPHTIASVGAELNVSAAILSWDAPVRYRVGFAAPVAGRELVPDVSPASFYFAVGVSF